jgi:hypothetical protein
MCLTDFTSHSIGVICLRLRQRVVLIQFVQDVPIDGDISIVTLLLGAMKRVVEVMNHFSSDFYDTYQYVAAEREKANIASLTKTLTKSI